MLLGIVGLVLTIACANMANLLLAQAVARRRGSARSRGRHGVVRHPGEPADVFHLMSIISPVDRDLAVVYSPLMPVPFREWLCDRGIGLVEVPEDEFDSMGANVLALSPRRCLMVEGNPQTRARLEAAGVEVVAYDGSEISLKGGGGPTCLTRPLARASLP